MSGTNLPDNFSDEYSLILHDIKSRVHSARILATKSVNRELVSLYWDIGKIIVEKQKTLGWGKSVVENLAKDLQKEFAGTAGFSARNLWDMKRFYENYSEDEKLRQVVAEIPWSHNLVIMNKVSHKEARTYYIEMTGKFGWSRNVLLNQIKASAFERTQVENKTHNFSLTLPEHLAEQANETIKNSYCLEFLGISEPVLEMELEKQLLEKLKEFILELGYGFCFINNQHRVSLGQNEYYIDLLFYHRFLKSLVAVELKVGKFKPEYAGKMDFYLNILNDREKAEGDNPSIGIILCAEKDALEVEFALKTKQNPIGVAEYQLVADIPEKFKGHLPTKNEFRKLLAKQKK